MLKRLYTEIKHIIRAALTSYRTSIAGIISIVAGVFLLLQREYALAVGLITAGAGLVAAKDYPSNQQP